ncbi:MAG: hypothetical protein MJ252_22580, partial [archaeon]|nr:hypothetical protein [archaeon]
MILNPLLPEGENSLKSSKSSEHSRGTLFKRRDNVLASVMSEQPNINQDINKVIIPYNFEHKKYMINESDISFYEKKDYLKEILNKYNGTHAFKIGDKYNANCMQKFFVNLLFFIIIIILLYIALIILTLLSFNPMIIYTFLLAGRKITKFLEGFKLIFYERYKLNEINRILDLENISAFCTENK